MDFECSRVAQWTRSSRRAAFCYGIELLVKCHWLGWRSGEVPVRWFERAGGIPGHNVAASIYALVCLCVRHNISQSVSEYGAPEATRLIMES